MNSTSRRIDTPSGFGRSSWKSAYSWRIPEQTHCRKEFRFRTLGLGYANLGSLLMRKGIAYDSPRGIGDLRALTAILTGEAYAASAEMAAELGPFPGFEKNREPMLRVMRNHRRAGVSGPNLTTMKA